MDLAGRSHDDRVRVAFAEIEDLLDRLDAIPAPHLAHHAVGAWSISEVVAHLAVVADFYRDNIERGLRSDTSATAGRPEAGTGTGSHAAAGISERAIEVATTSGGDARGRLRTSVGLLAETLARLGPDQDRPCYHPGGQVPANRFVLLALKEFGVHGWDVFHALQPPATIPGLAIQAILWAMDEDLASASLRWSRNPDSDDRFVVRLDITGVGSRRRDLHVDGTSATGVRLSPVDDRPRTTLAMGSQQFILAAYGRAPWATQDPSGPPDRRTLARLASALSGP